MIQAQVAKMDAKSITIVWLSLQLSILGYAVSKMAYRIGYLEGRASVYAEQTKVTNAGDCFSITGKGCEDYTDDADKPTPKSRKR
jgi:hypothetical protein